MTRRDLLRAGAGAFAAAAARGAGTPFFELPRTTDLESDRLLAHTGLERLARVTSLGHSTGGRRIDLISVGAGDRSALLVGAPHPNEPIGCLTLVRLLSRLARDPALRDRSGWQWHVIAAIDLDGLALNEGWFRGALSVERYCRSFYRPPFALQPEYAFPIQVGAYDFRAATPENKCWQKALALTRPQLQCSLHGSDSGGTFFLASENRPPLFEQLLALPVRFEVPLNPVGEPFSDMEAFRPGIVAFPAIESMLRQALEAGKDPASVWDAGDSSAGFAARTGRAFSLACEVPLWDDARLHREGASPLSAADTLRAQAAQSREEHALLAEAGSLLDAADLDFEEATLAASLREARDASARQPAQLEALAATQDPQRRLSWAELVQYEPGTAGWRTPAMLARLARAQRDRPLAERAATLLRQRIHAHAPARLRPVPLAVSSGLQLAAIDVAAGVKPAV